LTIKVQARHRKDCPHRQDLYWKKCNCRKQFYIYENGRARTESAKTRSWGAAEAMAGYMMAERNPVTIQARLLEEQRARLLAVEEQKRAEAQARRIPIAEALDQWRAGLGGAKPSAATQFNSLAGKVESWARENNLNYLDEIDSGRLYAWRGQWSKDAKLRRDQMAPATQNLYISILHRFFRWAIMVNYLQKDPSVIVKRRKFERIQTHPLSDAQFGEILAATYRLDEERQRDVPEYGRDLRAISLLQRWTGLRIIDALTLQHSAIRRCPQTERTLLSLVTKKTGKPIYDRPLPVAVTEALDAIPRAQEHVRPGHYFWSPDILLKNLSNTWGKRIRDNLNPLLCLTGEDGQRMTFRSHMLRDTFAVELLQQGVGIEEVSKLLTHDSIQMTERYYNPWVKKRREMLHNNMVAAMERMGAAFTPAAAPRPVAAQRLM
jgi:integrase